MVGFINPRVPLASGAAHGAGNLVSSARPRAHSSQGPRPGQWSGQQRNQATGPSLASAADFRVRKSLDKDAPDHSLVSELSTLALADGRQSSSQRGSNSHSDASSGLPQALQDLQDPSLPVHLPPPGQVPASCLDNWKLDMLVSTLGKNRATWRRALMLFEWLKSSGHAMDDRLCTTLIRICSDHGDAVAALSVFDWMVAPASAGGGQLRPTAYTYTAAMRAALSGGMLDRAMSVWNGAWADHQAGSLALDARLCITYIELCARLQLTDEALAMYSRMRTAPRSSRMAPTVHAYTAAMRAASEGGNWVKAMDIWEDMCGAGCEPTGHAYAAAISACAVGQDWRRAVSFFDEMSGRGIKPDVVSCTALITALATAGEAEKAQSVVDWMLANNVRPNARTYTALLTALGNAKQWTKAVDTLRTMQAPARGGVQPNAYTYSALLKSLGEHGQWQLAEAVFSDIERQVLAFGNRVQPAGSLAAASQIQQQQRAAVPSGAAAAMPAVATFSPTGAAAPGAVVVGGKAGKSISSHPVNVGSSGVASAAANEWTRPSQLNGLSLGIVWDPATASSPSDAAGTCSSSSSASSSSSSAASASASASSVVAADGSSSSGSSGVTSRAASSNGLYNPALDGALAAAATTGAPPSADGLQQQQQPFSLFSSALAMQQEESDPALGLSATSASSASSGPSSSSSAWWQVTMGQLDVLGSATGGARITGNSSAGLFDPNQMDAPRAGTYIPAAASSGLSALATNLSAMINGNRSGGSGAAGGRSGGPAGAGAGGVSGGSTETQIVNEVVCGALMLAYERAGKWQEAVHVLLRALHLGIQPNTVMYNTAISAAGKAGQLGVAEKLYAKVRVPDAVTHETLIAAYGMAGLPAQAEGVLARMRAQGFRPRDYAYCGLVAAYSLSGDFEGALGVRPRMQAEGAPLTVHVYNALLAACERSRQADRALELLKCMAREGLEANAVTAQIMSAIGRLGVASVESQQVAAAAVSAAVAAYGTLLIQTGAF